MWCLLDLLLGKLSTIKFICLLSYLDAEKFHFRLFLRNATFVTCRERFQLKSFRGISAEQRLDKPPHKTHPPSKTHTQNKLKFEITTMKCTFCAQRPTALKTCKFLLAARHCTHRKVNDANFPTATVLCREIFRFSDSGCI